MKTLCCCLSLLFGLGFGPERLVAQGSTHLIPEVELREALSLRSTEREQDIAALRILLARTEIRERISSLADPLLVEQSIASLDDETLRDLGERSRKLNQEIAAAGTTTWIVVAAVAVVAVVITIVLVERFVVNE